MTRLRRAVRFARLIQRRSRDLGRTCGPQRLRRHLSLTWLPRRVMGERAPCCHLIAAKAAMNQ
jgi:hypothetical protein